MELDDSFKRNKKREEMKDKNQKINDFLNEMQMINEKKNILMTIILMNINIILKK